jgi:hypothetical protein
MGKKKKETIRIIRKDSNKDNYTFVSNDNILNNIKDNEPTATTTTKNENKFGNKPDERIERKKIHSKQSQQKGRKIVGKSMQGHSPVYE